MDYLPPPAVEVVVSTQGMSKGILQEDGIQVIGGIRFDLGKNFYVRGEAKNTDSSIGTGEAKVAVGARAEVAGVKVEVEAARKQMLDPHKGADTIAQEYTARATKAVGPVGLTATAVWSPNDFGPTGRSLYYEGTARLKVADGVRLVAAAGHRDREHAKDYTAYSGGFEMDLRKNVTAQVRYYTTSQTELGDTYKGRIVGGVSLKF